MPGERGCDGGDQLSREQHARLGRVDADVLEDHVDLFADERRRNLVHRGDADGVLRRERDDRAHPVTARRGKRLQVGLNPGSASGVGAGDRETPWNQLNSLRRC